MTWFKIDDSFYDHPKVFDASDSAVALWVRAGCWSARNLTDGEVPGRLAFRLCDDPMGAVAELVERGLWEQVGDDYVFHDWHDYQPAREDVLAKREEARERMRALRAKRSKARSPERSREQTANERENNPRTFADRSQPPTRPDQSSKELSLFTADAVEQETEGPSRRNPETDAPETFPITEKMRAWARKEVPLVADDLERHTADFLDFHAAKGNRFRDWSRAWHKWMRKAAEIAQRSGNAVAVRRTTGSNQSNDQDIFARQMARAAERDREAGRA